MSITTDFDEKKYIKRYEHNFMIFLALLSDFFELIFIYFYDYFL
jgi:hypothetical protein